MSFTQNRLDNAEKRIDQFIDENIVDWASEEILRPTQKFAFEFGLSQSAANGMQVIKDGFMKAKMIWEYRGPDDEPLHLWLERGFAEHDIEAKGKDFGGADALHWIDKAGKNVFRKKVHHPGFEGYHIMQKGWDENKDQLQRRIIEETNNFLQVNRLE